VLGICLRTGGINVEVNAGYIFFCQTFVVIVISYLSYEATFYGWKQFLCIWIPFNLLYAIFLIATGITFIALTMMKDVDDFTIIWNSLSTYGRLYFDNDVKNVLS
jgi:hypothetical protein